MTSTPHRPLLSAGPGRAFEPTCSRRAGCLGLRRIALPSRRRLPVARCGGESGQPDAAVPDQGCQSALDGGKAHGPPYSLNGNGSVKDYHPEAACAR